MWKVLGFLAAAAIGLAFAIEARAFTPDYIVAGITLRGGNHEAIIDEALGFLRPSVRGDIRDEHENWADADASSVTWVHMDGCAFGEGADQINSFYGDALINLIPGPTFQPWSATDDFGRVFHPAQDFYSHSNWVELGFPANDNPATSEIEVFSSDLIDFSTRMAGPSGLEVWVAPGALETVRDDILLADMVDVPLTRRDKSQLEPLDRNGDGHTDIGDVDVEPWPATWTVGLLPHPTIAGAAGWVPGVSTSGSSVIAPLATADGLPVPIMVSGEEKRLLISGIGDRNNPSIYANQCDPFVRDAAGNVVTPEQVASCRPAVCGQDNDGNDIECADDYSCIAYYGSRYALTHGGSDRSELNKDSSDDAPTRFPKAFALAVHQSKYEWCRLVKLAGDVGGDGIVLSLWVREGASANPANTPCQSDGGAGPLGVEVAVEQVVVLDDKDDPEDSPGEINLSLAVYDDPANFHRLSKSRLGAVDVPQGGTVPGTLPPVTQCVNTADGTFRVALHGWDDDDGSNGDFNQNGASPGGANVDDALIGFTETLVATDVAIGSPLVRETESSDLRVRYRVSRLADVDGDGLDECGEQYYATDPSNPDTDDDGLLDGIEVNGNNPTHPLIADSDGDGLEDGDEDENANGALDPGESDPNDVDTDRDLVGDGAEVLGTNPTDPADPDSDDDGLSDGEEDVDHDGGLDPGETNPNDADSDDDLLEDGQEIEFGTDPLDRDSDDDGLIDGQDGDFIVDAILDLPESAFIGGGNRVALLNALAYADKQLKAGKLRNALSQFAFARSHIDGCGVRAGNDDWITDCSAQVQIRGLLDLLVGNL